MNEKKYFICDIEDEDLAVVEKWLIKVSIIDSEVDEDKGLVSRKIVFELIQEILNDEDQKALELSYEICKLPLYLSSKETKLLKANGHFERTVELKGVGQYGSQTVLP